MKTFLVAFALIGLALASSPSRSLQNDFKDIVSVIPVEKIRAIAHEHVTNDEEFKKVVKYLQGSEWANLVAEIKAKPAVQNFNKYMLEAGIDMEKILEHIHDIIANAKPKTVASRSLRTFLDEVKAIFPMSAFTDVVNKKLSESGDFQAFYFKVSDDKARALVQEVAKIAEVQRLKGRLVELGVNVDAVIEYVKAFLGWV